MDERIEKFIERVGMFTEAEGLPRIAGRIFGLLLVQPGECSLDDMAETLGVSKASISTDARRLETFGLLQRTSRPGDRRDYYSVADNVYACSLEHRIQKLRKFHQLMQEARDLPIRSPEVRERLDRMDEAYDVAITSMSEVLSRLQTRGSTSSRRR